MPGGHLGSGLFLFVSLYDYMREVSIVTKVGHTRFPGLLSMKLLLGRGATGYRRPAQLLLSSVF